MAGSELTRIPNTGATPYQEGVFPADLKPLRRPGADRPSVDLPRVATNNGQKTPFTKKDVTDAVEQMNKYAQEANVSLRFGLYGKSEQFYVQVVDQRSNQVVKMLPAENLLKLREKLREAVGVILDESI